MEWEDHFNCVSRSKIVRQIIQLRKDYDKLPVEGKKFTEKESCYLTIIVLEDLLA